VASSTDPARARLQPRAWVEAAFDLLADGGIDAVRIAPLCVRLGVTKGSFYHHFESRDALLDALADFWAEQQPRVAMKKLAAQASGPLERIERMTAAIEELGLGRIDHAIRIWGQSDPRAARAVAKADGLVLDYLEEQLAEAGIEADEAARLARLVMLGAIGSYLVPWISSERERRALAAEMRALLKQRIEAGS